jgi:hypothetical protein
VTHSPASASAPAARVPADPGRRQPGGAGSALGSAPPDSGGHASSEWPLQSHLVLGALPGAVPCARLHARQMVWEWGLAALADDVELLVSELVTNAVRASTDVAQRLQDRPSTGLPQVELRLACDRKSVFVQVQDSSPGTPTRTDADLDAESRRGLLLVEHLSTRWGAHALEAGADKVVWALVSRVPI